MSFKVKFADVLNFINGLKPRKEDRMNPVYQYFVKLNRAYTPQFSLTKKPEDFQGWSVNFRHVFGQILAVPKIENASITDAGRQTTRDGLRFRKVWVRTETEPAEWFMPVYVVRPPAEKENGRLLIGLQAHGPGATSLIDLIDAEAFPKLTPEVISYFNYNTALDAVRMGFTLVVPELRASGELKDPEKIAWDKRKEFPLVSAYSCGEYGGRLLHFGRTLLGMRVYDMLSLLMLLAVGKAQKLFGEFDQERIGIFGHSGGGTVALFTAAMQPNWINAVCVSGYFCEFEQSILAMNHCACNYVPNLGRVADISEISALVAPRPFLVVAGKEDEIFPIKGARAAAKKVRKVYEQMGQGRNFVFHEQSGMKGKRGHRFPDGDFVFKWFKQLK